jgi:hypothetical protein
MSTAIIMAIVVVASLSLGIAAWIIPHHQAKAASIQPGAVATYTLITGDRVLVTRMPDGKPTVSVVPDAGSGGGGSGGGCALRGLQAFASGQHLYVVPDVAAGYIGAPLALDLFDVNALPPDSASTAAAPPQLTVQYTSGSAQQLPPGLSKKADGSVVVADRKQFGHALAQSWHTDVNGTTSQLFAGISRIAPASATAGSVAPLPGQLFTVTVKAFDRNGQKAVDAFATLVNVDSITTYVGDQGFFRGDAAFSVPAGHYSLNVGVHTHYPDNSHDAAFTIMPEIAVSGDATIVIHAKEAQLVSATTPLPATADFQALNYQRIDAQADLFGDTIVEFCGVPLFVTPATTPVSVGTASFWVQDHLVNSAGDPAGYTYDLDFPYGDALPATLAETVTASHLATIDSRFHSPVLGRAEDTGFAPFSAGQQFGLAFLTTLVAPTERTQQFVTAQPHVFWQRNLFADDANGAGFQFGYAASYPSGQQVQDDWMAQPMGSGIQQDTQGFDLACPVCRSGDTLTLSLFPFTDEHARVFDASSQTVTLTQNGTQVGQLPGGGIPLEPYRSHLHPGLRRQSG